MTDENHLKDAIEELTNAWFTQTGTLGIRQREHHGLGLVVYGLVSHAHTLARAYLKLLEADLAAASHPTVRQLFECCITAAWLEKSGHTAAADLVHEATRQRRNVATAALKAWGTTDPVLIEIAKGEPTGQPGAAVRHFEQLCNELDLQDPYFVYRFLSGPSHAGGDVVDLYLHPAPDARPLGVAIRHLPRTDDVTLQLGITLAALVNAGNAWQRLTPTRHARSLLKRLASEHHLNLDVKLSAAGLKAQAERERRYKATKRTPFAPAPNPTQ